MSALQTVDQQAARPMTIAPRRNVRRILRRAFWLGLMFVAGALAGAAGTTIQIERMRHEFVTHPERIAERLTLMIKHDAGLTDAETQAVRQIVEQHHLRFMKLHHEFHPKIRAEFEALETEVGAVMTEAQRQRWQTRFRMFRERMIP